MRHISFVLALGCVSLVGLAASLAAGPADAQTPSTRRGFQPPTKQQALPGETPEAPPPALPGATSTGAPAEKTVTDLPPTEALFDAINRGDIASARDAVGRGADLGGRNVLGMTPLDLSVDLSRNDITFLLLSLRPSDTTPANGAPSPQTATAKQPPARVAGQALPAKTVALAKRARPLTQPPALPAPPRQYAGPNDSGTPDPQAGFLGFGSPAR